MLLEGKILRYEKNDKRNLKNSSFTIETYISRNVHDDIIYSDSNASMDQL